MQPIRPTQKMIESYQSIYQQYKDQLRPNKKGALAIICYLHQHYPISQLHDNKLDTVIKSNAAQRASLFVPQPDESTFEAKGFAVKNSGAAKKLYEQQDGVFKENQIVVGIECTTDFFMVEGSSLLSDELTAYQGLNQEEIHNYYLAARYILCLEKFNLLDCTLNGSTQ